MNFFLDFFYPEKRRREKEQRERYQKAIAAVQAQAQASAEASAAANAAAAAGSGHQTYLSNNNLYVHGGLDYNSDGYMTYGRSFQPTLHPCDTGVGYTSDGYVYANNRGRPAYNPYDAGILGRTVFAPGWRDDFGRRRGGGGGGGGSAENHSSGRLALGRANQALNRDTPAVGSGSFKGSVRSVGGRSSQVNGFPGMFGRTRSRTLVFPFRRERGSFWGTFRLKYDPRLLKAREERTRWEMTMLYCWNSE